MIKRPHSGLVLICLLTCTCGGIHPGWVEPASPRHSDVSWVGSTPRLALQLTPSLSGLWAPERPLFTPSLDGDARDTILIGRGVMTAPPFIGPFCMSLGAQSTAQSWHTDPPGLVVESVTPMRRVLAC